MRAVMLEQQSVNPRTVVHIIVLRLPKIGMPLQLFATFRAVRVPRFPFRRFLFRLLHRVRHLSRGPGAFVLPALLLLAIFAASPAPAKSHQRVSPSDERERIRIVLRTKPCPFFQGFERLVEPPEIVEANGLQLMGPSVLRIEEELPVAAIGGLVQASLLRKGRGPFDPRDFRLPT